MPTATTTGERGRGHSPLTPVHRFPLSTSEMGSLWGIPFSAGKKSAAVAKKTSAAAKKPAVAKKTSAAAKKHGGGSANHFLQDISVINILLDELSAHGVQVPNELRRRYNESLAFSTVPNLSEEQNDDLHVSFGDIRTQLMGLLNSITTDDKTSIQNTIRTTQMRNMNKRLQKGSRQSLGPIPRKPE